MSRRRLLAGSLLLAAAILGFGCARATASPPSCPAGVQCVYQPLHIEDMTSPGTLHNSFLITDSHGAPVMWNNVGGTAVGGEPVCTTDLHMQAIACIGGPWGNYGGRPSVALWAGGRWHVLTARDIDWIHARGG